MTLIGFKALKKLSHQYLSNAVRCGWFPRLSGALILCCWCNKWRALHWDHGVYSHPLSVIPVCRSCNAKLGKSLDDPRRNPPIHLTERAQKVLEFLSQNPFKSPSRPGKEWPPYRIAIRYQPWMGDVLVEYKWENFVAPWLLKQPRPLFFDPASPADIIDTLKPKEGVPSK